MAERLVDVWTAKALADESAALRSFDLHRLRVARCDAGETLMSLRGNGAITRRDPGRAERLRLLNLPRLHQLIPLRLRGGGRQRRCEQQRCDHFFLNVGESRSS